MSEVEIAFFFGHDEGGILPQLEQQFLAVYGALPHVISRDVEHVIEVIPHCAEMTVDIWGANAGTCIAGAFVRFLAHGAAPHIDLENIRESPYDDGSLPDDLRVRATELADTLLLMRFPIHEYNGRYDFVQSVLWHSIFSERVELLYGNADEYVHAVQTARDNGFIAW